MLDSTAMFELCLNGHFLLGYSGLGQIPK